MKYVGFLITFCMVLTGPILKCFGDELEHEDDHGNKGFLDPYDEILELYNIEAEQNFTTSVLQELVHDFSAMLHCSQNNNNNNNNSSSDGIQQTCASNFSVNTYSLLSGLNIGNVSYIEEGIFDEISLVLLETAVSVNGCCHGDIHINNVTAIAAKQSFIDRLTSDDVTSGLNLVSLQNSLKLLKLETDIDGHSENEAGDHSENEADNHSENGTDAHSENEAGEEGHMDTDDEHAHAEVIEEKCLGADVLFDQLGFELDERVPIDTAGKVASLVVYHILSGAKVSRDCRLLPRRGFFFKELEHMYGHVNHTLDKDGFSNIMSDLEIGSLHAESEADEHDDHDAHRRKRDASDDILFSKSSWETKCYSDEELLAVFQAEESDITVETFSAICPALIQQKLAGVCAKSEEHTEEQSSIPSELERYGFGSLAAFIVCLCSVIGAIVVKVASSRAYDVIMAVFLGLATSTLFTDSMLHLLPAALGVHNEAAHAHSHSGSGIEVEEFVWYSLVACGALYAFYLFEKTMVLARGEHGHSHDIDAIIKDHDVQISSSEKYIVESEYGETKKKGISNGAVMILMGDAVHNFADGLAIGASFSSSLTLGLSTTIAVFCHELPHELGDFAFLLASGMQFWRALFLNALISITAMIGLYAGLVISDDEAVKRWIFAVAAGLFIYISLVDMMPKLLQKTGNGVRDFVLHNIGIFLGTGAMLTLAVFEEKISVSV